MSVMVKRPRKKKHTYFFLILPIIFDCFTGNGNVSERWTKTENREKITCPAHPLPGALLWLSLSFSLAK